MIVLEVPAGFAPGKLAPPDLSESPQITLEQWDAYESASGSVLIGACFVGEASAWMPEATEIAQQKLAQTTNTTALRAGEETTLRPLRDEGRAQILEGGRARAKTMLGFEGGRAHGCFALCVRGCADAELTARFVSGVGEPPAPSRAMRAVGWAVHHPNESVLGAILACAVLGFVAIVTRPRPRKRG